MGPALVARCDQPGFVDEHDGLDVVAEAEFGQYPSDVDLDGSFGQVQVGGDLTVGSPGGELDEDRLFPVGELAEHGFPVVLLAGSGSRGANWSMSRRVAVGARTASPPATVRMAVSSSAGGASLRRNPLAPALSP